VELRLLPLVSMAQQQLVLALHLRGLAADLVQCANMSWLGYPTDTVPSARDFMPGLTPPLEQAQQALTAQQQEDEGPAVGTAVEGAQHSTGSSTPYATQQVGQGVRSLMLSMHCSSCACGLQQAGVPLLLGQLAPWHTLHVLLPHMAF
jgi:hypothetical protein